MLTKHLHWTDSQLRSVLRIAVAVFGLLMYIGDPSEDPVRRPYGNAVLMLFVVYAVTTWVVARRGREMRPTLAAWIDVGWATLLVAVSEATSSVFFPLYVFPILCASFGGGFRPGFVIALSSALGLGVVGSLTSPAPRFDVESYVIHPLYILLVGYMTASWGEHEVSARARLSLLREVTTLSNPRFGVDRTLQRILLAICSFQRARSCRLVVVDHGGELWMRSASPHQADLASTPVPASLAPVLVPPELPSASFQVYRRLGLGREELAVEILDPGGVEPTERQRAAALALAAALDASVLLSVPVRYHASAAGRLHVVRQDARRFGREDAEFMHHVLQQVMPVLENIRLVDRLASDAADDERLRIARDLHDSVIQPYLGLRLGLSAAHAALSAGQTKVGSAHVERLMALADDEIRVLRRYVRELRDGEASPTGNLLVEGVQRFCRRFSDATGIQVAVATEGAVPTNDRLAAEVFQMVAEALSNVRRHTSASGAAVRISSSDTHLDLTVSNDVALQDGAEFFPRSIGERAAALGGSVQVERPATGTIAVHVKIPL